MTDSCRTIIEFLDCEYELFEHETNGDKIIDRYRELYRQGKQEGFTPLIVIGSDNVLAEQLEFFAEDVTDKRQYIAELCAAAAQTDINELFDKLREQYGEMLGELEDGLEDEIGDMGGVNAFSTHIDMLTKKPYEEIIIAKIPTDKPWELPIYVPMGGYNDCPVPEDQAAVFKYWYEKYNAVPAIVSHDTWELAVGKSASGKDECLALANEMYLFNYDIVEQGTESIGALAAVLDNSGVWYFWWD